jgi:hypothetical protein
MFEHRTDPLLSSRAFRRRLARYALYALALLFVSLAAGVAGFIVFADENPIDALLNSAMLLGGMGPVGQFPTTPAKLFATVFALYSGLAFLGMGTILLAPIFHRVLHRFHVEERQRSAGRHGQVPGDRQ